MTGQPYGYQLTFFRTALAPDLPARTSDLATNQVYMAHFALTDGGRETHESFDRYSRGAANLAGAYWRSRPTGYGWRTGTLKRRSRASIGWSQAPTMRTDRLLSILRCARHAHRSSTAIRGSIKRGAEPGNASYYYSLTGLQSTGVITSAGQAIPVTGTSWMDHEFSTSTLSGDAVGWDWFSIQFENGAVLMLYQIRNRDGTPPPASKVR